MMLLLNSLGLCSTKQLPSIPRGAQSSNQVRMVVGVSFSDRICRTLCQISLMEFTEKHLFGDRFLILIIIAKTAAFCKVFGKI